MKKDASLTARIITGLILFLVTAAAILLRGYYLLAYVWLFIIVGCRPPDFLCVYPNKRRGHRQPVLLGHPRGCGHRPGAMRYGRLNRPGVPPGAA